MKHRIHEGEHIPLGITLWHYAPEDKEPRAISSKEVFSHRKIVLFGLPGAFTNICNAKHLPDFVSKQKEFKDIGVECIACISINDAYVMKAWGALHNAEPSVLMLADPSGEFHKALGLLQDLPGLGQRALRYSMLVDDGVVKILHCEEPGPMNYQISGPWTMLQALQQTQALR